MKKLLSTLAYCAIACVTTTALAAPPCGDGINNLKIWDGGGVDNNWNTAANWSPDGVPDCDDDVRFNGTSTKTCDIYGTIQVRDFSVMGSWTGRIYVRGTSSLQMRNLVMQGGMLVASDSNGLFQANDILMGFNAYLSTKTALITGTWTMNNSVFAAITKGYVDIQNLVLNNFAKFTAPDGFQKTNVPRAGIVYLRGNLTRQALGLYMHKNGLARFCGSGNGTINTNNTLMTFWNIEIDKKRDGAGDTTAPGHLYTNGPTNDRIFALNRLSLMEATLTGWAVDDWVAGGDSVIVEPSMANNDILHSFSNAGHATLAFLGSGNGRFFHKTFLTGNYNVWVEKGSATDWVTVVGLQDIGNSGETVHIAKGRLTFDGSGNARLRASVSTGLHVLADGQLVAPDDDTLFFAGCWDFANSNAFNPQNGVLNLDGTGNRLTFTHHDDTVFFNEVVITVTNGGVQGTLNWSSVLDVMYVRGNLKITSADAYLANIQVFLEGNLLSAETAPNTAMKFTDKLVFKGSAHQSITLSSAAKNAYNQLIELDKTGGSVTMSSDVEARAMRFSYGVLNTNGYLLNITLPTMLYGGNSNSYINGPVTVAHGGLTWPASVKIPVGKSTAYNPIYINNGTTGNTYTIEYFNTGYSGTNTVNAPLDAVSSTEYWKVDRVAGATAYQVGLPTTNAPGGWSAADIRVAGNDGTGWNNLGPAGGASGGFVTSTTGTTSSTRYFTLGVDNAAPMVLVHDGVSGKELQTERFNRTDMQSAGVNTPQMQVFPNPAQNRFAISLEHAASGVVSVSDLNGRILFTGNAQSTQWIDCSSWSSGIYLVRFTDGINSITRRISVSY
ncbi:MAG: T9SS type A sorting domain-containing protein [Bacteroidetes bacterium]|nr:T9SS type A sorting domain-containing protein [Bacteroidota bacterium]